MSCSAYIRGIDANLFSTLNAKSLEETHMKTIIATAALTILFLSAGAFAGKITNTTANSFASVTIVFKNSQLPVVGQTSTDACAYRRCISI
jgi:hypothetical protein